jgi:murein L,D-transpeptidase YcbB/YkuD
LISTLCITQCKSGAASNEKQPIQDTIPQIDLSIPGRFNADLDIRFDSNQVDAFFKVYPNFSKYKTPLQLFYHSRNYACAWYDKNGLIEPAHNIFNRISNFSEEGLPNQIQYKNEFDSLMQIGSDNMNSTTELMLTCMYLTYADKAWIGVSESESKSIEWLLPRKKLSYLQLLDSLTAASSPLENEPVFRQYNLLKNYLKKYRSIQKEWPVNFTIDSKKTYKKGDSALVIAQVRKFLLLTEDIKIDNASNAFDEELEMGIKAFQERLGLKSDGILKGKTIQEMNIALEKRIEQIMINMERCRWIPASTQSDFLVVNIPEFKLHVFEKDSLKWSMNVVVGKSQNKTVIFSGGMKYIVFSPYWNIPTSILQKETLPAIKRSKNYLAKHNMEWNGGNVRQKPGPNNSLGLVKFLFPNSHSIYLHDTPSKSLFNEDNRAFSHGCIRLAEPQKLALYLLRNQPEWTPEKVSAAMNLGKEQYVPLKSSMPVIITYFTSWVDKVGKLNFRNDVYGRDKRLANIILK